MNINRLDHLVLTVKDVEAICSFYADVLGMEVITFGDNRKALQFGIQKINLHQYKHEIDPKAISPTPGSADLCFITDTAIEVVIAELKSKSIPIIAGPAERTGAMGKILSVYFRDPDGNLLEVSRYL
jgi:catechol 2,3-dioxygenase-like lactoylglutathione lyase family enzyme